MEGKVKMSHKSLNLIDDEDHGSSGGHGSLISGSAGGYGGHSSGRVCSPGGGLAVGSPVSGGLVIQEGGGGGTEQSPRPKSRFSGRYINRYINDMYIYMKRFALKDAHFSHGVLLQKYLPPLSLHHQRLTSYFKPRNKAFKNQFSNL